MVKEFEELPLDTNYLFDESMYRYSTLLPQLKLIEQAKKDAWNAAIKWCADNAKVLPSDDFYSSIDKQSILNGLID